MVVLLLRQNGIFFYRSSTIALTSFFALLGYFSSFSKKPPSERWRGGGGDSRVHTSLLSSSASRASFHSCCSTRRKWLFSRVSRNGTPLAICVSQMITRGRFSVSVRAASKAATSAGMSLPFTRCVYQPKASHLAASGSKLIILED